MVNRAVRVLGPAVLLLVALIALFATLAYGGGAAAPELTRDPGALVRYGLPTAKLLFNIGAAGTIGALALAVFAFARDEAGYGRALDVAAGSAALWAVASLASSLFSFLSLGASLTLDDRFGDAYAAYLTSIESGQAWLGTTLLAAAITVVCFGARNQVVILVTAIVGVLALIPISQQGHAAGNADHDAAVTAIWLHMVGAAVWLGGLITLALVRNVVARERLVRLVERYSSLALACFVVVAVSGVVSAQIRIGSWEYLLSTYGVLVLVKSAALLALGLFGAVQRRIVIRRMADAPAGAEGRRFALLVVAELAFMGLASGVASGLARTRTPIPDTPASELTDPTPAELLTGRPLPPELTLERYLTTWDFDLLFTILCGFALFFYLAGVWRLHRRGDRWPVHRTVLWVAGILLLFWITNGGVNAYEHYLFSAHMLAHMMLGMMVPVLLVPGAPVTLALRAIRKRQDGSRGAREWIMWAVHSKVAGVLANPIVAAIIFAGSLWLFYYSPLFSWATTDHVGHWWMVTHFLISGYLFVQALIGVDPVPYRAPYPLRLLLLLGTMAFHAFFGLAIMSGTGLLLADWYGAMGREWGPTALADQQAGGGIAWSVGEIPTVILAFVVAVMWSRDDSKEAKRRDRAAERDGDAELNAYNDMLAARSDRP